MAEAICGMEMIQHAECPPTIGRFGHRDRRFRDQVATGLLVRPVDKAGELSSACIHVNDDGVLVPPEWPAQNVAIPRSSAMSAISEATTVLPVITPGDPTRRTPMRGSLATAPLPATGRTTGWTDSANHARGP